MSPNLNLDLVLSRFKLSYKLLIIIEVILLYGTKFARVSKGVTLINTLKPKEMVFKDF
jgi:hypothetical protein